MGRHHGEVCGERDILGATTVKFVGQMACVLRLKAPSRPRTYAGSSEAPGAIPKLNPRGAVCGSAQPCIGQWAYDRGGRLRGLPMVSPGLEDALEL